MTSWSVGSSGSSGRPPEIDTSTPSVARVYDAVLNGKDNFAVDRAVRDQLLEIEPEGLVLPRDNRAWLERVVGYLAGTVGIDQFVDCGSGLPTANNTHQIAQRANPGARVVYADNDPVVLAHGRALLEENEDTRFIAGDVRHPQQWLADPALHRLLDFDRPIGVLHAGILHHVLDEEGPLDVVAGYVDALVPGSYLAISHFHNPHDGSDVADAAHRAEQVLVGGELGSGKFRQRGEIEQFFDGLELLDPGVVFLADWWPESPERHPLAIPRQLMLGGLARKP